MAIAVKPEATVTGTNGAGTPNLGLRDIEVWCQAPDLVDWAKLSSQIDQVYPFDSGTADDYISATDYAVTHVQWWGGNWNTAITCPADFFVITFYTYDGTCFPPDPMPVPPTYLPNNYYHQEILYSWNETVLDPAADLIEYSADIGPVLQDAGTRYWIEIQAGLVFSNCGQWGWLASLPPADPLCTVARGFPLLAMPYWTRDFDYPGVAFCLYSDLSVPTEDATWGGVKSLYR
jgi:hypothetical protein